MNFLIELFAELFGWFGLGQAVKDFEKGNKKRAIVLLVLFLIMLAGILIYIIYSVIRFFKTY
jgi:succinate dehydrogenase hydrophobic anchor subunit